MSSPRRLRCLNQRQQHGVLGQGQSLRDECFGRRSLLLLLQLLTVLPPRVMLSTLLRIIQTMSPAATDPDAATVRISTGSTHILLGGRVGVRRRGHLDLGDEGFATLHAFIEAIGAGYADVGVTAGEDDGIIG